jgi:hypothetical protein
LEKRIVQLRKEYFLKKEFVVSMKKQGFNPYLPSWEYIPDGVHALYFIYEGSGFATLGSFTLE